MLGTAAKIEVTKENCTIVGDGSSEDSVKSRVKQIRNLVANTEQDYEKEKLNERIARLSGGVAIIQVSHWTHCLFHPSTCLVFRPASEAELSRVSLLYSFVCTAGCQNTGVDPSLGCQHLCYCQLSLANFPPLQVIYVWGCHPFVVSSS